MIGLTPELAVWLIAYTFITTSAIYYGAVATNESSYNQAIPLYIKSLSRT